MTKPAQRTLIALVLAALLILLIGSPTAAQQSSGGIRWSAEALFDGHVKYGEWLPIRVTLANQGQDRTVDVRASVTSSDGTATFVQPVELPAGARKQVDVYVLPASFSRRLRLSLVQDREELASTTVEVQPVTYRTFLIGLIARDPDALSSLRTISLPQYAGGVRTVALETDEIPERSAGLASFDVLVFNDVDTSQLSPAQQQALATWIHLGGHLVAGGGAGASLTTSGLPASLLPVAIQGSRSIDSLPGLAKPGNEPVRVPGPFVVTGVSHTDGSVLAAQDGLPLVVQHEIGQGRVTFIALDLALSPFGAWAGEKAMWTNLLQPNHGGFAEAPPDVSPRQIVDERMMGALSNLPSLDLPSVRWVVLLLAVYIVLVGPANYLFLRRAGRLEWAWLTIPAMTLTFGVGAYSVGYRLRGGEVILNKLSIIEVLSDAEAARVRTYAGLFSPTKRSYTLQVAGEPLISSLNPRYARWGGSASGGDITVIQGQPTRVRDLAVNQWSMQTFVAESIIQSPLDIQAELTYHDGRLQGQMVNPSSQPLEDVVILIGDDFAKLGTVEAGQTTEVDLALATTSVRRGPPISYLILQDELNNPGPRGPSREARLKQQVLDGVFVPAYEAGYTTAEAGPLLIGWLDDSPQAIQVAGASAREIETSLVVSRPALHFGDREVSVPPGIVPAQLVQQEGSMSKCYGGRTPGFAPYQGAVVLEFRLPHQLHDIDVSELNLIIETDGGWGQPPATALYDWQAGAWHALDDVALGTNRIDAPARFISPNTRAIRVRMQATGDRRGGCLYTNVALEGTRVREEAKE